MFINNYKKLPYYHFVSYFQQFVHKMVKTKIQYHFSKYVLKQKKKTVKLLSNQTLITNVQSQNILVLQKYHKLGLDIFYSILKHNAIVLDCTLPINTSIPRFIAEVVLYCNFTYKSLLPQCILKNEGHTK